MSELSADVSVEDGSVTLEIPWISHLKTQGYKIDAIEDVQTVDSGSREISHVVARITTYDEPFGSDTLDLVEDKVEGLPVCSCEDYTYNQGATVEDAMVKPSQSGTCKHIRKTFKAIRAANDEQQETL